jgi:hypothetical protein
LQEIVENFGKIAGIYDQIAGSPGKFKEIWEPGVEVDLFVLKFFWDFGWPNAKYVIE